MNNKILYEDIYSSKNQFSFGKNRAKFLEKLDDEKIELAKQHLNDFLGGSNKIDGTTVIDFGCGSGLMSLGFVLNGAKKVLSVDIDDSSVECAKFLREKFNISHERWEIKKGSILDDQFVSRLGKFDIVYSWGVIHHSGNMWKGLDNIETLVDEKGLLYVAIYNDFHGFPSSTTRWKIKRFYSSSNKFIKTIMDVLLASENILLRLVRGKNPITYIKNYGKGSARGMDFYTDIKDWLGGFPYEYASLEELKHFYKNKGYIVLNIYDSSAGTGCHELLFSK